MTSRRALDKQHTRDRISAVATQLFLERGFEDVTVAEVAAAAGVSKVTVFAHFPRKEDLLLDRAPEAAELARSAVSGRSPDASPVAALRRLASELADQRHPLSGLREGTGPFLRTVATSPALRARLREQSAELEQSLRAALVEAGSVSPAVLAALVVAAYRVVVAETVGQMIEGVSRRTVIAGHRRRLDKTFDALEAAERSLEQGLERGAGRALTRRRGPA